MFAFIGSAAASPIYGVGFCGSFDNPAPNPSLSGTFACPSAASLGITDVTSEFVVYNSDYSSGLAPSVMIETDWTFGGATFFYPTDTTTSSGTSTSNPAVGGSGVDNPLIDLPPVVLAGLYDNATVLGTPIVGFLNQAVTGTALEATGYAEVVYFGTGGTDSPVPEPGLISLVGGALLGVCLYRRKKAVTT